MSRNTLQHKGFNTEFEHITPKHIIGSGGLHPSSSLWSSTTPRPAPSSNPYPSPNPNPQQPVGISSRLCSLHVFCLSRGPLHPAGPAAAMVQRPWCNHAAMCCAAGVVQRAWCNHAAMCCAAGVVQPCCHVLAAGVVQPCCHVLVHVYVL